ncbi:guanylate kinase [Microbacterium sp. zg.B48]|uniref:guanylate kinase n=1 Tax=unclassified Microbacterium TaxID=2609290 RepID=UPI00214CAE10|nr:MULTISPECIES: guanylate kinase [unclassified Microbacterium]MCR2762015.1 guanylate kinase [Microbacterium sp. zg.B48]MCR2811027.1 guanylate kinase [Microbacterium sp. zg.B185]WIM17719.1 guanylate kinase [Microbacterium sp. zg-B185]
MTDPRTPAPTAPRAAPGSPTRPPEVDRLAASRRAVAARRARAALKKDVAMRVITPQELARRAFADPTSPAGTMRVTEYLTSLPAIGEGKRDRILEELQISPVKRLGGLGARQRRVLSSFLDARWPERQARGGRSRLVVLAGPTAVGKGTVAARIHEQHPEIHLSVSATTRPPRPGEVEGQHYFFVDDAEFDRLIESGELLEHATVHNKYRYGTPRRPIEEALAAGRTVLLEIDLQGARQVRAAEPSATLVFLLPPSWDELVQRLVGRGTEDDEERARRLRTAKAELAAQNEFDFLVVNDDVAAAAQEVVELVDAPARPSARV